VVEFRQNFEPLSIRESTKSQGAGGIEVAGYAARFDVESYPLDSFYEQIRAGAFAAALADREQDTIALRDHNPSDLLGRRSAGTLSLHEDKYGLAFRLLLPPTQLGNDVATLIRRGDLNSCSFGFNVAPVGGDTWSITSDGRRLRTIRSVSRLIDVSLVTCPAYPQTSVALGTRPLVRAHNLDAERLRLLEISCPK